MKSIFFEWLVPFTCGLAVSISCALAAKIKKREDRARLVEDGVESLLRLEIVRSYNEYTERGYCPIYAKESLTRAYNDYHALGGNDVATSLYEKIMALPTERAGQYIHRK